MAPELLSLILTCAPAVHPATAMALIKQESAGQVFAIGVNGGRLSTQPRTREQAAVVARVLIAQGYSVDVGLAQINSANFARLGLTVDSALDPCSNLRAMQRVLLEGYQLALKTHGAGQPALQAALSAYNTGNTQSGLHNGYVRAVYAQAR